MHEKFALRLFPLLVLAALGCATASGTPRAGSDGAGLDCAAEVLASPALLREGYTRALDEQELELAYRYLALIHILHPTSAEDLEVFTHAAKLFKQLHTQKRVRDPLSIWTMSEPIFMIEWLLTIFEREEGFPEQEIVYLFRGMPLSYYQQFETYAKQAGVFSKWDIQVKDDNGRVASITGTRIEPPGPVTGITQ